MDPQNFRLKNYEQLESYDEATYRQAFRDKQYVIYYNLIVDYSSFSHPGEHKTIERFKEQYINDAYQSRQHSFNSNLILCHRSIGKISPHNMQSQGKQFYLRVKKSQKNKKHEEILSKMDFSKPILSQIRKLSVEEFSILTTIPKIFKNPDKIYLKGGLVGQFMQSNYFWLCFAVFQIYILSILVWIFSNHQLYEIFQKIHFLFIGAVKWTLIQYYFHRFPLHQKVTNIQKIHGHLIHHSFPNLRHKLALGIFHISYKIIIIAYLQSYIIGKLQLAILFTGFIFTMSMYDSIHYYCHFGPSLNISWLKTLKTHHLKHHYRDNSRFFGVTNTFWDSIFGTSQKLDVKS